MTLSIYSTLSRQLLPFKPLEDGRVNMYVCGVTVYDYCHIGHGRTFVAFDVIRRWLEASGYQVTMVRNITDVDDKIIRRAAENNELPDELTARFIQAMQEDMLTLGCLAPTHEPRATDHIGNMLNLVELLQQKGYAYQSEDGDVNYSVRAFKPYGALSGKSIDDLRAGERVAVSSTKRDPLDFVLWKSAKPGEPAWASPYGQGRPGWHIECSAMAMSLLGPTIDIHGGGPDLIFPHHENEIAQSEAATGQRFANYWMHSGPLRVRNADGQEEKMSKSLGNFWTIRDAVEEMEKTYGQDNGREVLRFFLMRSHYRSPISFSNDLLDDAHKALARLYGALDGHDVRATPIDWQQPHAQAFKAAMDEDFHTPRAISVLFDLASEIHRTQGQQATLVNELYGLGRLLNLFNVTPAHFLKGSVRDIDEASIEALIAERVAAKAAKDYGRADAIRQQLLDQGIELLDAKTGTVWRRL